MFRRLACAGAAALALNLAAAVSVSAQTAAEPDSAAKQPVQAKPEAAPSTPAAPEAGAPPAPAPDATTAVAEPPPPPVDPLLAEVRKQLADAKGADRGDRGALTAFYAERGNGPLVWVDDNGFNARARHAMAEIAKADDWGLVAASFALPQLGSERSQAVLADAEIKLGLAVLKYARFARGGRIAPSQVSRNFDQKPSLRDPKDVLNAVAATDTPGTYLVSLHPKHPQFELLRQALLKARAGATPAPEPAKEAAVVPVPDGPTLRLGMEHPQVSLLRKRLGLPLPPGAETIYDLQVRDAVRAFQDEKGIKPTGVLTPRTRSALNGGAPEKKPAPHGTEVQRLLVNMERWRWLPEDLGSFYVWDNVPEFQTRVMKNGRAVHQAKIVVGKPDTQTVLFSANMRYVVFGPEWGVPDSIKVKEILPYLRPTDGFFGFGGTDTRVLQRHNLRVSYNGRPVDPSQINWSQVDIRRFTFIQPSGGANVLGAVKFRFPNRHDIYMHDTPQRELFEKQVRAYSHGCMRVQYPGRLAEVLLGEDKGWSADHVRGLMARGGNNEVELSKQIPVHVTYFTAIASEDGKVHYFGDIYGHDNRTSAALSGRPLALEPSNVDDGSVPAREARRPPSRSYKQTNNDFFSGLFGN